MTVPAERLLGLLKAADLKPGTALQPHQQRVRDRFSPDGAGTRLLLYHTLGSGKTLSGLAAADAAKAPYTAVVPASLRENFRKEQAKFMGAGAPVGQVLSQTALGAGTEAANPDTLLVDEAHRLRNPETAQTQTFLDAAERAKNVVLMTGTPVVNDPADFAPLYTALTGNRVSAEKFREDVVEEPSDGWMFGMFGKSDGGIADKGRLRRELAGKIDYHAPAAPPVKVNEETVSVDMSRDQAALYRRMYAKVPTALQKKLRAGQALSRPEIAKMTAFLTGPRQVGLSTLPFDKGGDPLQAFDGSPKLTRAMELLQARLAADPKAKALVFSNFIDAGLTPYQSALTRAGVPAATFSGKLSDAQRKRLVEDYNAGKTRVALLGPSGTEGLSFKGTRLIQQLDPHWNEARGRQSTGRGVRFDSHVDLPEDQQTVDVQRFHARLPDDRSWLWRLAFGAASRPAADDHLAQLAARKEKLNQEFLGLLREIGTKGGAT